MSDTTEPSIEEMIDQEGVIDQLRKANERLLRQVGRLKNDRVYLGEKVYEAMMDSVALRPPLKIEAPAKDLRRKGEEIGISVLSDWQLGKITSSYNTQVCEERIKQYSEKVVEITEIARKDHPIKRHVVFFLGDMVEGELIFPGQAHLIDSSLGKQVADNFPRIASYHIARMLETHDVVEVYSVWGNHGYLGGRSRKEMHPESNADNFGYKFLRSEFSHEPRVTFHISEEWYQVANLGEKLRFLLLHGNNIRGYNGLPWYGYSKKILGWAALSQHGLMDTFDYALTGHFHTPTSMYVNGFRVWVNGSTESHNAYAQEQLAAMGDPSQWLMFAKPGAGITAEYLITMD